MHYPLNGLGRGGGPKTSQSEIVSGDQQALQEDLQAGPPHRYLPKQKLAKGMKEKNSDKLACLAIGRLAQKCKKREGSKGVMEGAGPGRRVELHEGVEEGNDHGRGGGWDPL